MLCLDTYALIEIINKNPKYSQVINSEFSIPDTTLSELYWVLLKEAGREWARYWYNKMKPFVKKADVTILIDAMDFKHENKKQKLSFFDCFGYIFASKNGLRFVTGDKEFKNKDNVMFIEK